MALTAEDRALMIKKLLNKAEAKGTTPEEREALSAKATQLMMQWGIEEALVHDADRAKVENIVERKFQPDCPASYSHEFTVVGIEVARAFGCRGYLLKMGGGKTGLSLVGFESDVERTVELFTSIATQVSLNLATAYADWLSQYEWLRVTGTDKFNWKRSFIRGFASGLAAKFKAIKTEVIQNSAPGTELVLVDRKDQVDKYIQATMNITTGRARRYVADGAASGREAGLRADVGQTATGGSRKGVGR